jgi:YidC/Oxa1 family membrane protein insertase
MEKRVLLAVILSFIVLYGFQAMFPPPPPAERREEPIATGEPPAQASPPPGAVDVPAPQPEPQPIDELVADETERDIVVENAFVRGVFSSRGAVLKSWRLKRYFDDEGQPLELVPPNAPEGALRPFALSVENPALTARLQRALYKPSATEVLIAGDAELAFEYQGGDGLSARKVFRFTEDQPYVIAFTTDLTHQGAPLVPTVHWGPALGDGLSEESSFLYSPPSQPIFYQDGDVTRVGRGDIPSYAARDGVFGFAGVDDHYFMAVALPAGQPLSLRYQALEVPAASPDGRAARFVEWAVSFPAASPEAKFFFGPKDFRVLRATDGNLVRAIHFGIFSPIVVPLLQTLNWINGYVGNYGWSIILLTAIINIMMFPLRHKSVVSMRKMQAIQPEIKAIQERYKSLKVTDPARQKMNAEMMNLYRERGVNPASGCVPMLLTLPVLISFYSMLSVAVELRGAPFIGWITDLSRHDPLFVTPVLMGATQFVQTKMTPSTMDPTQQKVMLLMPLMFMAFFLWAPSGLVLYWTVANMWAIGQQALTNKIIGPMPQRSVRPPAERKLKSAGAGRSEQASKERK